MKKFIIILLIAICTFYSTNKISKIDDDYIRIRILANSNNEKDLKTKDEISKDIEQEMYYLLKDTTNKEDARTIIKQSIPLIEENIEKHLTHENYSYKINYGYNYFPEKEYNGTIFKEGEYESLLITLGEGKGNNWWCILFPPLCLIEAEESEEIEYQFFLEEFIYNIFH